MAIRRVDEDAQLLLVRRGGQWVTVEIHYQEEVSDGTDSKRSDESGTYSIDSLPPAAVAQATGFFNAVVAHRDSGAPSI